MWTAVGIATTMRIVVGIATTRRLLKKVVYILFQNFNLKIIDLSEELDLVEEGGYTGLDGWGKVTLTMSQKAYEKYKYMADLAVGIYSEDGN